MARVLYIDAPAGLSGDMLGGAMLALGMPLDLVRQRVEAMGLKGVSVDRQDRTEGHLAVSRLVVELTRDEPHRSLAQVMELAGRLPGPEAALARKVFTLLGEAEAAVHGSEPGHVHLHEVGMSDALTDVAAFCAGLVHFDVGRVVCSPLPLGRGFVQAAHGRLPLPAPAVLELLRGCPVTGWPEEGETVTPTGAALAAALSHDFGPPPDMTLTASSAGCGTRSWQNAPNLVRLMLGEEPDPPSKGHGHGQVVEIACHLDDMSPEDLPMVFERIMAAGALDVAAAPLYMKKGRPGLLLSVMAEPGQVEALAQLVLEQTTTLGVRLRTWGRRTLAREVITVESPWGEARVKRARVGEGWRMHPEADDVARICRQSGLAPQEVRAELARLAREK